MQKLSGNRKSLGKLTFSQLNNRLRKKFHDNWNAVSETYISLLPMTDYSLWNATKNIKLFNDPYCHCFT